MRHTRETITETALSRFWDLTETSQYSDSDTLGTLDEWRKDNKAVRVFYTRSGAVRKGWSQEGNQDWFAFVGQGKADNIVTYLKTEFRK